MRRPICRGSGSWRGWSGCTGRRDLVLIDKPEADILRPVRQVGPADTTAGVVTVLDHAVRSGFVKRPALRAIDAGAGFEVVIGHAEDMVLSWASSMAGREPTLCALRRAREAVMAPMVAAAGWSHRFMALDMSTGLLSDG